MFFRNSALFRLALVALSSSVSAAVEHRKLRMTGDILDSYIVVLNTDPAGSAAAAESLTADLPGVEITHIYDIVLPGFAANMTAEEAAIMADSDLVNYIEQDGTVTIDNVDSWGLDRVDQRELPLDNSFNPAGNGNGVFAYIIDTGIRISHEDFGGRAVWGTNTVGDGQDTDCNGHGTHVAGTVGGTNYGIATGVELVAVKVLSCSGSGSYAGVIAGVNWVAGDAQGKKATANMSLGGGKSTSLDDAVTALHNGGVTTVVAAGNSNADACNYSPAGAADIFTVASTDSNDSRSSFSSWGPCIEIFAPGRDIKAPWHTGDNAYNTISGTSMASPHVCGGAALLLGMGKTPAEVDILLLENATPDVVSDPRSPTNLFLYVGAVAPTVSPAPTSMPSPSPTRTPPYCEDSEAIFGYGEGKRKCKWVKKRLGQCDKAFIRSFCPKTCKACAEFGCKDATTEFYVKKKETAKAWTCAQLAKKDPDVIEAKCGQPKFATTCRETCEMCGGGEELIINFDEAGDATAPYFHPLITLDNVYSTNGAQNIPGTGYEYGTISPPIVGLNGFEDPISFTCSGGLFDFVSSYMTPAWTAGTTVTVVGYSGNSMVGTVTITLGATDDPKLVESELSGMTDLDRIVISTAANGQSHTVFDNMIFSIKSPCNVLPQEAPVVAGDPLGSSPLV